MEKRVIIFLVLSLAIIFGYDYILKELGWLPQPPPKQEASNQEPTSHSDPAQTQPIQAGNDVNKSGAEPVRQAGDGKSSPSSSEVALPSSEQTVTIETDLFRAELTNRGGVVKSWELKRYRTAPPEQKPVQLVYSGGKFRGPLSIAVPDPDVEKALREGLYTVEKNFTTLNASHPTGQVTLRFQDSDKQLAVEKQLTFHHDSYIVDIAVRLDGVTQPFDVGLGTNFGIVEWGDGFIGLIGSASLVDGKVEKETPDTELERKGAVQWVALQDKYFLSVLMPRQATAAVVKKEGDKIISAGVRVAAPASGTSMVLQLYAGPKEYDTLRAFNVGLEDTIDFGWFIFGSWSFVKAVAKPIFYVLRFLYEFTHNYGITIILLTMGLKLLFVPLQYKSYKSMKQMQVIQPRVLAVQEKFKEDRDRLNKELIKLYRDHKVNPVGGCLPMVLQMPVFVALFNILYMTIDLRQAPFMLWITDLSAQDPYYVLPLIMGATMVIQQKITPTTMDPTQAKIMLMLPAFMTFLFINFPAGLVLYWLTNNVLTILQQVITDRYIFGSKPLLPTAPAQSA
jgi:YidC/Oxa1 family membrane protein insertase